MLKNSVVPVKSPWKMNNAREAKKRMKMKIVIRMMNESLKSYQMSLRFYLIELKKRKTITGLSKLLTKAYSKVIARQIESMMHTTTHKPKM